MLTSLPLRRLREHAGGIGVADASTPIAARTPMAAADRALYAAKAAGRDRVVRADQDGRTLVWTGGRPGAAD